MDDYDYLPPQELQGPQAESKPVSPERANREEKTSEKERANNQKATK
jgi:hypothetical protein